MANDHNKSQEYQKWNPDNITKILINNLQFQVEIICKNTGGNPYFNSIISSYFLEWAYLIDIEEFYH